MAKRKLSPQESGRRGGKAKVPKGFSSLTADQRSALSSAAAKKRWADKKGEQQ
jgi:hypothetical protein